VHGIAFELAAALFNVIWWYAQRNRRLLDDTIGAADTKAIARRFQLALAWLGVGTLLGAVLPVLGVGVFAAFILYFWLPISCEAGRARPRPVAAGQKVPPRKAGREERPRKDRPDRDK
jgi:uncharacterized membrane protein